MAAEIVLEDLSREIMTVDDLVPADTKVFSASISNLAYRLKIAVTVVTATK